MVVTAEYSRASWNLRGGGQGWNPFPKLLKLEAWRGAVPEVWGHGPQADHMGVP